MSDLRFTDDDGVGTAVPYRAVRAIGAYTGLLGRLEFVLPDREDPEQVSTKTVSPEFEYLIHGDDHDRPIDLETAGKGASVREGVLTHVGETVERYSYWCPPDASYRPFEYVTGTYEEVCADHEVVDEQYLSIHPQSQLDRAGAEGFDPSATRGWVEGTDLTTGGSVWVPEAAVTAYDRNRGPIGPSFKTSNGCACGSSPEQAILGAIEECVERDAFMRTWYTARTPARLDPDAVPGLADGIDEMSTSGKRVHLLSHDCDDGFHVVSCAVENRADEVPKFLVAAAADLDLETAVEAALDEMYQATSTSHYLVLEREEAPDVDDLDRLADGMRYYTDPANFEAVEHLIRDNPPFDRDVTTRRFPDERAKLRAAVEALEEAGVTPLLFDLTTPEARELGMTVVRVVIPEYVPLGMPIVAPLDHPAFEGAETTTEPHPFP